MTVLRSVEQSLDDGLIFGWDDVVDLKLNPIFVYSFQTGDEILRLKLRIQSPRDKGMDHSTLELFAGGSSDSGTEIFVSKFSNEFVNPAGFLVGSVFRDRNVVAPGSLIAMVNMVGHKMESFDETLQEFVLIANTHYQIVLTNVAGIDNDKLRISALAYTRQ